jgi:bifunctional enzyme CysN/CysC
MSHHFDPNETDIETYLAQHERKDLLRFLTCGNVDDGKSTLIGRLLHDTKAIYEDQLQAVARDSKVHGTQGGKVDLALLVDGLKSEREQGITIDVAYRYFSTARRKFIIADTPGHEQYTRNMATGASTCDLAIILIDARKGVTTQTRRHSFITSLLGIREVIVAVNKMDLAGFSEEVFNRIRDDYLAFAAKLPERRQRFIPMSALDGDNVVDRSTRTPWWDGVPLLETLNTIPIDAGRNEVDFRFPVQFVNRPDLDFRGFCGTVASGSVRVGDEVVSLPSGRTSTVKRIVTSDGDLPEAFAPQAVTLTLADEIDASRGDLLCRPDNRPTVTDRVEATLVWMHEQPLVPGREYLLKNGSTETPATVERIKARIDVNTLERTAATSLGLNEIGSVEIRTSRPLLCDPYARNRATGGLILIDRISNATVGAGMVAAGDSGHWKDAAPGRLAEEPSRIGAGEREARLGQKPTTVLITGLGGSGKSAVARELERKLFDLGRSAVVLDGQRMRMGLNRDLGFSAAERSENLRRSMEVARILNDGGLLVVAAFVAPEERTRDRARELIGSHRFLHVHLTAPIEHCRSTDPSGIYREAAEGRASDVPGLTYGYEAPERADLRLASHELTAGECAGRIVDELRRRGVID